MEQNYWEAEDKKYIWHPAMQMKDNEVFPPVVIDHAKGSYLYGNHLVKPVSRFRLSLLPAS